MSAAAARPPVLRLTRQIDRDAKQKQQPGEQCGVRLPGLMAFKRIEFVGGWPFEFVVIFQHGELLRYS